MPPAPACSAPAPSLTSNVDEGKVTHQHVAVDHRLRFTMLSCACCGAKFFHEIPIKQIRWALLPPATMNKMPYIDTLYFPRSEGSLIRLQCAMWFEQPQQLWLRKQGRLPPAAMTLSVPRLDLPACATSSKIKTSLFTSRHLCWFSENRLRTPT